ncbi:hypothetical protein PPSIR1_38676 [Plesiocystis pacifica SIR-1]|uniref:Uncharacterized protein n=1 Tax=Plesiocystis pacifica SIR-1 TaxID=391625 RepID=A6G8Q8_9BACT|nr:hypothetical protein [Plesiocystis pacifica]EDM77718.1 hypothetical protein PPSIR1_38676 [Plesiocystis pacifica SIR-1]
MSEPELLVYAAATMNGWKPLTLLEELRELDPSFDYAPRPIDFIAENASKFRVGDVGQGGRSSSTATKVVGGSGRARSG